MATDLNPRTRRHSQSISISASRQERIRRQRGKRNEREEDRTPPHTGSSNSTTLLFSIEVRAFLEREYDLHHKFLHFPGNGLINFLLKFDGLISYTLLVCA